MIVVFLTVGDENVVIISFDNACHLRCISLCKLNLVKAKVKFLRFMRRVQEQLPKPLSAGVNRPPSASAAKAFFVLRNEMKEEAKSGRLKYLLLCGLYF